MKSITKINNSKILLLVIYCILVVFGSLVFADFLGFDDKLNVLGNANLSFLSWKKFLSIWETPYFHMYIPVTYSLWAIIAAISRALFAGKLIGGVFHLFNIILHIVNTCLVYSILVHFFNKNVTDKTSKQKTQIAAGLGALLFAVHPIQVEAVAWVTGMKDLLGSFFSLCCMLLFLLFYKHDNLSFAKKIGFSLLLLPLFCAALMSKPSTVVVPVLIILLCSKFSLARIESLFVVLSPWFVLSVVFVVITKKVQPIGHSQIVAYSTFQGPMIAADSIVFYLKKIFYPDFFIIDYGRTPSFVLQSSWRYLNILVVAAVCAVPLLLDNKKFWFTVLALFIVGLLPVLGLIPFEFQHISDVADRYAYLSMFAVSLGITYCLLQYDFKKSLFLVVPIISILMIKGVMQTGYWRNSSSLMGYVLTKNPKSITANVDYCVAMMINGHYADAINHCQMALDVDPNDVNAHYNLGLNYIFKGNMDLALKQYKILIETDPKRAYKLKDAMRIIPKTIKKQNAPYPNQGTLR